MQPELRRGSRSPRRRRPAPVGAGEDEGGPEAGEGAGAGQPDPGGMGGPMMGQQMAMMGMQQMMRQMMMGAGNPMAQEAMMRQQQLMMRQFQQQMLTQMGAMQQFMMGQQQAFANAMRMSGTGDGGCPAPMLGDPEEAQRQMGRQAYASAVAAMNRREAPQIEAEEEAPSGPSSSVHHPNYRPPDAEPLLGVTDRRFEGKLKLWFEDKGYGFIECPGLKHKFPDVDVFLHQNQKRHFAKNEPITFSVFMNFRGKPQATELRRAKDSGEDAGAA